MFLVKSKKNHITPPAEIGNPYLMPPVGNPYMYYNYAYQIPPYQMPPPPLPPSASNFSYTGYDYNSTLPSIEKLLEDLDQIHGKETYTKYLEKFLKEKITVDVILTLNNNDLISLGVNTIGERKILIQAAKFYLG